MSEKRNNEKSAAIAAWSSVVVALALALLQWLVISRLDTLESLTTDVLQRISYIEGVVGQRRAER